MKNRKMIFGTIILLSVMIGFFNFQNVSAVEETTEIQPLSYAGYNMGYLENKDEILINEINALTQAIDTVNVYIMNEEQFETMQDSGGLTWNYIKIWQDVVWIAGKSIEITEDGYYYVVIYNNDARFSRNVYVNLDVRHYSPPVKEDNNFFGTLVFIILPAIAVVIVGVLIVVVLVRTHKRKIPKEDIKTDEFKIQEKQMQGAIYCPECGSEILDKTKKFCSLCGNKINK